MRKIRRETILFQSKRPLVLLGGDQARARGRATIAFGTVCFAIFVLSASSVAQTSHRAQR
jgi:hypothetical protein